MLTTILLIALLALLFSAFWFAKTSKAVPKSWYEWKTEIRYQYVGIMGLIDDFLNRSKDKVELYKQPGRIAVITGGSRGIGLRIVEKLLACDMTVVMGVRDPESAREAVKALVDLDSCGGKLICEELDVGNLKSVREFARKIIDKFDKVHILINNAGIMFAPYKLSEQGFESHFCINYLGHLLLQHLLLPFLKAAGTKAKRARIVNISSCAHLLGRINYNDINGIKRYHPGSAYSQSKLAQIMATRHLKSLLEQENAYVQVIAIHPGIVDTDLFEHSATTSVPLFKKLVFKTPEQGSRTPVHAAISPSVEGQSGIYLSNCQKCVTHRLALDPKKCEKLFNFSCELLKIKKFGSEDD